MKMLICSYLLAKSLFKRKFTWFDIDLAKALKNACMPHEVVVGGGTALEGYFVPTFICMIANLAKETTLPEAFADFMYELKRG